MKMKLTQRLAAACGATAIALTVFAGAANADPSAPAAPPTSKGFDVQKLCTQRLPKIEDKANKLIAKITGGADVTGSSANLRARAEKARTAGNDAQADWLNGRAQHRDERLDVVKKAVAELDAYKQKYCTK
jgi:hypothetical protein